MRLPILLCVVLLIVLPTFAQPIDERCGSLAADDCTLLLESEQSMADLNAAAFDVTLTIDINPMLLNIPIITELVIIGDYVLNEKFNEIPDNPVQLITNWITGITSDANIILTLPTQLNNLGFDVPEEPITLDLRMVDGFGYANLVKILDSPEPTAWYGIDLITYYNEIFDLLGLSATSPLALPEEDAGVFGTVVSLGGDFTRLDDDANMVIIEGRVDGDQILADEDVREQFELGLYLGLQQQFGFYSDEELQEAANLYAEFVRFFEARTTRMIDPATGYQQQVITEIIFTPDPDIADTLNTATDPIGAAVLLEFAATITLDVRFDAFNAVAPAQTPETYELIPLDDLLPGGLNPGSGV